MRHIPLMYTCNNIDGNIFSLLQLRSGGILPRLESVLVPSMPQCKPSSGFASARAADVMSALFVIITGYIAAVLIGKVFNLNMYGFY